MLLARCLNSTLVHSSARKKKDVNTVSCFRPNVVLQTGLRKGAGSHRNQRRVGDAVLIRAAIATPSGENSSAVCPRGSHWQVCGGLGAGVRNLQSSPFVLVIAGAQVWRNLCGDV